MKIRRMIGLATFAYGMYRSYRGIRKSARKQALRVAKSI